MTEKISHKEMVDMFEAAWKAMKQIDDIDDVDMLKLMVKVFGMSLMELIAENLDDSFDDLSIKDSIMADPVLVRIRKELDG